MLFPSGSAERACDPLAGTPLDQSGSDNLMCIIRRLVFDFFQQHIDGGNSHLFLRLFHSGHVDLGKGGDADIVESDQGDVSGNTDVLFPGCLHETDGI